MPRTLVATLVLAAMCAGAHSPARAQAPDARALLAAQRAAMERLAALDGVWRGPAWTLLPSGERHELTQTERIGSFLGGSVKVIEGKGYEADGTASFNALGIISFNPATRGYTLHTHAQGRSGDYVLTPTADGYVWEIAAGPMTIRYTAVIRDGTWHEVGERIIPGQAPVRIAELNLRRIGDTDWPGAGAVPRQ